MNTVIAVNWVVRDPMPLQHHVPNPIFERSGALHTLILELIFALAYFFISGIIAYTLEELLVAISI